MVSRLELMATGRPALAAAVFFAALTAIFFAPSFGRDFIFRDSYHEFLPMMLSWAGWSGVMPPTWYPYVNLGAPAAGSVVQAIYYPVQFLLLGVLRLPPSQAMNLFIYLHYWMAAMGMWALGRALGGRAAGPLVGGVGYAFGGYLVSMHYARNLLPGFGLAPFALALLLRGRREGRAGLAAAAGMCLGLVLLGGDPQTFAVVFVAGPAAALLLVPAREASPLPLFRSILMPVAFWLVAVLTASAELIPALENFSSLGRAGGFGDQALVWSFHPARILEFFSAGIFGRAWPLNNYWGGFTAGAGFALPMALSCSLGAWAVVAVTTALSPGAVGRRTMVLAGMGAVALLLALGGHAPLYPFLLAHLPGFGVFRYPEKYLLWFVLVAAALASAGTDAVVDEPRSRRSAFYSAVGLASALAVLAGLTLALHGWLSGLVAPLMAEPLGPSPEAAVRIAAAALGRSAALFGFCAGLLLFLGRDRRASVIPALFLFADLFAAGRPLLMAAPDFYSAPSRFAAAIAVREKDFSNTGPCSFAGDRPCFAPGRFRVFRDNSIATPMEVAQFVDGRAVVDQLKLRRWERDTLKPNLAVPDGLEDFAGMNVASSADFERLMNRSSLDLLPRYNVKYAVIPTEQEQVGAGYAVLDRLAGASLVQFTQVWPRVYWLPESAVKTWAAERSSLATQEASLAEPPAAAPIDVALSMIYRPDEVIVRVKTPGPGWVVLNDAHRPDWRCDGHLLFRFESLVRAVYLERPGETVLHFRYRPAVFPGLVMIGLGLIVGFAGLFFAAIAGWGRSRRLPATR